MRAENDLPAGDDFTGLLWGGRAIAAYLGRPERWLRRQLARGKKPPPTFRLGTAIVADPKEIDTWLNSAKQRVKP